MHVWEFAIFKFVTLFAIISTGAHCNILNTQQILRVSDDTAFIIRYKNQLSALDGYFYDKPDYPLTNRVKVMKTIKVHILINTEG